MSYNAEQMWEGPRPPFGPFQGHTGESYPSRWPHGFEPRMRGCGPLPFRGGAMHPGPPYAGQVGAPYRDAGKGQEGAWEDSRPAAKEQMNIPRRGVPGSSYSEQSLAPDMDYREREVMEPRNWPTPDVDYRSEDGQGALYRVRLPPTDLYKEREATEYRKRLIAEREIQERKALELEHRKRMATTLDYRQREAAEMDYNLRMDAIIKQREREEALLLQEREYTERLLMEREVLERLQEREAAALALRDREAPAPSLQGREVPAHIRQSADLDLRVKETDQGFMLRDRALGYQESLLRESATASIPYRESLPRKYTESATVSMTYQENMSRKYSEGTASRPYKEQENPSVEYMEGEHPKNDSLTAATVKDAVGFTSKDKGSTDMSYRQGETSHGSYEKGESQAQRPEFQKAVDADYRKKDRVDSDYRKKENSDTDYRGQENTDLNFRDAKSTKTADLDYREKERADSDYREKESADSDYRESADTDYRQSTEDYVKERADKMEDTQTKTKMEEKSGFKIAEIIPFLSFSEEQFSSLANIMAEIQSKTPAAEVEALAKSELRCPGKLDMDFRDRLNAEDVNSGGKERTEKLAGYMALSTPSERCSSDQDLRSKDSFSKDTKMAEGNQGLWPTEHLQKDEDLRGGKAKNPEDFFGQNVLLLDFLRLAAKELRDKRNAELEEKDGEAIALAPAALPDSSAAEAFHPDVIARSAVTVPLGPGSSIAPQIELLCREDTDYRNIIDFNDVDLRVGHRPDKRLVEKRSREDPQPGSKDKDYRRTPLPEGATKILWLDGLPTGASREEILCALGSVRTLPEGGANLIGYIPGYSLGSVCVEFSLVEEAVGCMEANKGVLQFKGKKINLKYIPNSDQWTCLQCKIINALSKERCWQCSALRAGTDHLSLRDSHKEPKTPPSTSMQRGKKRKAARSPGRSPDHWEEKSLPTEKSPQPKTSKGAKQADSQSATVILRGIGVNTSPESVVKALKPYAQLSPSNVRILKIRKGNHRGFCFIDLKSHKEAIRLTVLVRDLKQPVTIDGKAISIDLAVGQRKDEHGKSLRGNKSSPGKNRGQRGQRKAFNYSGFKADEGPSYIYDPKTGCYVDPLADATYDEPKTEQKRDDYYRDPEKKETLSRRRGFTEEKETEEEAFKKPLPPPMMMKKEEPPEPKVNPLLGLIGAYAEDSEEEEEKDEEMVPPLEKKPTPPPPVPALKPVPKPEVKPIPKPEPKPAPSVPIASDDDKLMDWKNMVCLLCRRQFTSKEALIKHKSLSLLHKQNLVIHQKMKKSQKELEYLQKREQEENQCIQRRLLQAKKELEMLEREEEGAQQEAGEGLDTDVLTPEKRKAKSADTRSELSSDKGDKKRVKPSANQRPSGESYRENMKRLILERYKELE